MRAWLIVVAGCYAPTPPAGAPCAENGACPSGLACVGGVCGGGAIVGDAPTGDAPIGDAPAPADCWAAWKDGAPALTAASLAFSSPSDDVNPSLSPDALALYLVHDGDFYRAARPTRTAAFGDGFALADLSSTADEDKLTLSGDALTAVLSSNRTPLFNDYDLWIATRSAIGSAFGAPVRLSSSIDTPDSQFDPWLSSDGLTLYYAELPIVPGAGSRLKKATRGSTTAMFFPASVNLDATQPFNPVLSPDQLTLVYTDKAGIMVATRNSPNASFHNGAPLAGLPSGADNPELSRDGCELVFDAPGATSQDIFHAFVMP